MKAVSARQMRQLDARATRRYGIPSLILMENAGRSAAEQALRMLPRKSRGPVAVICGWGNNGGDGLVCSRHLLNKGIDTRVYLAGKEKAMSPETSLNYGIMRKLTRKIKRVSAVARLRSFGVELSECRLIIDGIFGIGLRGEPDQFFQQLFAVVNESKVTVLALDIPSGLDADTGVPLGSAIRAARTITFGRLKKGLALKRAAAYTGSVVVGDISLPDVWGAEA